MTLIAPLILRLTHINYAFLIPNADGTFAPLANAWKLKDIVSQAHQAGVKVLISVGGWGWDEQFETLAADPTARSHFVQNLSAFVDEYALDGADIDWEYPRPGQSAQNFLVFIQELRLAMPDRLLTTAVVSHGETGDGIPTIQAKTKIAMERAGGIMFWTLDHDALDDLSLLKAIDDIVHQE